MEIDRRLVLAQLASVAGLASAPGQATSSRGMTVSKLTPALPLLSAMMPTTDYYEIASAATGTTFAVWVSRPEGYNPKNPIPAIYMPDGNTSSQLLGARSTGLRYDPIHPIKPFLAISVGYMGAEAKDAGRVRNRDLVPPGEPVDPMLEREVDRRQRAGGFTPQQAADYKASLRDTHADRFMHFLTDELHPAIAARYSIDESTTGLFGYSYGGLFSLWAAMQKPALFSRIGAGSPGILVDNSMVFADLERRQNEDADYSGRSLHMTVNELEQTAPTFYQGLGENFAKFNLEIGQRPLRGLNYSARVILNESHQTGVSASWYSFLRTCYSA